MYPEPMLTPLLLTSEDILNAFSICAPVFMVLILLYLVGYIITHAKND